jgi:outer membrane receptor for ferrienterochelin and colicins
MSILSAKFRLAIVPLSILLAYSANSQAQQNPTEDVDKNPPLQSKPAKPERPAKPATEKLQQVEISGAKGYDERRQDTASKIVVTQEDIIRYGDTNISDVLKRLPGVTIGGVQGRGGSIRMRGLGSGYTMVMLNGEPSPPGFSLDSISPDIVERIEVIRSGTAEHSTQAIAGAINIVLKKAIQTAQRELKLGAQEDGGKIGGNLSVQLADKLGRMSYSVSGNLNRGSYDRPSFYDETGTDSSGNTNRISHGDVRDWGTYTSVGMAPRINWNLQNGDTITSQSFVNGSRFSGFNTESTKTTLGTAPMYASSLTDIDSNSAMLRSNLNWIHKLADSAKLDFKLGANFNQRSSDVIFSAFNPGGKQILDRQVSSDSSDKGYTYSGKYSAPFFEDHDFVAGWDGAYSKRSENRDQLDHVLDPTSGLRPLNLNEDFAADVTRLALFAQDEWKASKNWSFYAGLRWEGLETRSSGNSYAEIKNRSSVWSPILQTLWKLPNSKNDQVRLGLTRTYKAPDTNKLIPRRFISSNNSATSPDSMGNPNLKPELAWGLDAAFEHYLDGGGSLSASVFLRRIEDITRTDLSEVNGTWISMPVNAGIATTRGIEFDGKFALRSLMKEAPAIDFRGNLSFNWSDLQTVPGPNNRLDSQTPISANLGVDYKLDRIPLTIGGNYSFQNGGPVRISFNQSTYSVPKRQLDLYGLWKFDRQTSLRLSLSNTLKQDNISASTYTDTSGALSRSTTTPTTAAIRAMLEYKF